MVRFKGKANGRLCIKYITVKFKRIRLLIAINIPKSYSVFYHFHVQVKAKRMRAMISTGVSLSLYVAERKFTFHTQHEQSSETL